MLKVWEADNFRRTLAGLALIAAPLAMMVSEVIYKRSFSQESDGQFFAAVAEKSGTWTFARLLGLLAAVLFVPAVVGMVHLTRERGVVLGHVGGALAIVGAMGYACHQMLFVVMGEMARFHPNPSIAGQLHLSTNTVGNYISNIFTKLQVAAARRL